MDSVPGYAGSIVIRAYKDEGTSSRRKKRGGQTTKLETQIQSANASVDTAAVDSATDLTNVTGFTEEPATREYK